MKLTSLDSLCSWDSIFIHVFNMIEVVNHEGNHFEDTKNDLEMPEE